MKLYEAWKHSINGFYSIIGLSSAAQRNLQSSPRAEEEAAEKAASQRVAG